MKQTKTKMTMADRSTMRPFLPRTTLRFGPAAWAKLLFLRDWGETEVGGFGISADDDLLLVEDIQLVGQACTGASVSFDDASVADFFDAQVDGGLPPSRFARIWAHTHPGDCPRPSAVDEETFDRVFGRSDWAVMFILAQGGKTYARLGFNAGPGGSIDIPVEVDYSRPFAASDHTAWEKEYAANVQPEFEPQPIITTKHPSTDELPDEWLFGWCDYVDEDDAFLSEAIHR